MFKKLTALVLVMGMVLSIFAGCRQTNWGAGTPGSTGAPENTSAPEPTYTGPYADYADGIIPGDVMVRLTEEATKNIYQYTPGNFLELSCRKVIKAGKNWLMLKLQERTVSAVLEAVAKLTGRSDIDLAEPHFYAWADEPAEYQGVVIEYYANAMDYLIPYEVVIQLTEEAAERIGEYGVDDFPEIQCKRVFKSGKDWLVLVLEESSVDAVLAAIDLLTGRSDLDWVEPSFDAVLDSAPSDTHYED